MDSGKQNIYNIIGWNHDSNQCAVEQSREAIKKGQVQIVSILTWNEFRIQWLFGKKKLGAFGQNEVHMLFGMISPVMEL